MVENENTRDKLLVSNDLDVNNEMGVPPGVILNELLAYYTWYKNKSPDEVIVNTILMFYTPDEIRMAKELLWRFYGYKLLGKYQKRRGGNSLSVEKADMKDIQDALKTVDSNLDEDKQHSYVAKNMERLPKSAPQEAELGSIVTRLRNMELEMARMDKVVTQNVINIEGNATGIKATREHVEALGHASFEATAAAAELGMRNTGIPVWPTMPSHPRGAGGPHGAGGATAQRNQRGGRSVPEHGTDRRPNHGPQSDGRKMSSPVSGGPSQQRNSDNLNMSEPVREDNSDEQGFQMGREERRKQRRKAVFGKKRSEGLKAGVKPRELFLFGLDTDTTAEDIAQYIKGEDDSITIMGDIQRRSKEDADTSSFLIKVSWPDSKILMEPEFWPVGAGIRPYFRKRQQTPSGDSRGTSETT